jgi:hypothetical protein
LAGKTALYVLLAALALAALTNRWVAASGSRPGFNIVSFDGVYFAAQWIAFGLTIGGLVLLGPQWHETGRFPPLVLLGAALLLFFVGTGIPQTTSSYRWMAGDVGLARWMKTLDSEREAREVMPHLLGTWKSDRAVYAIERDSLSVTSSGKTEQFGPVRCAGGGLVKFAYATERTLHFNPAADQYYALLEGPPVPSFEAGCAGRLFTFLKVADGKAIVFRDVHEQNPTIETLTR